MDGRVDFGQVAEIGRKETRGAAAKRILDYGPKFESAAKRLALSPTDLGTDNHQLTTSPPAICKSNGIAAKRVLDKQMIPEENQKVSENRFSKYGARVRDGRINGADASQSPK